MLDLFMNSEEYNSMIEKKVDEQPEYKVLEREYLDTLDELGLDLKVYDAIDNAATILAYTARDIAYKVGFEDGVRFILNCTTGDALNTKKK